jgi:hypothetical protein
MLLTVCKGSNRDVCVNAIIAVARGAAVMFSVD